MIQAGSFPYAGFQRPSVFLLQIAKVLSLGLATSRDIGTKLLVCFPKRTFYLRLCEVNSAA